jgi:hypothetical protein
MSGNRIYLQPVTMIYNAILDMMELQRGHEIIKDPMCGKIHFRIILYGFEWELQFAIMNIEMNRSSVTLEIEGTENDDGDEPGFLEAMLRREYALLDSMLLIGTPLDKIAYQ